MTGQQHRGACCEGDSYTGGFLSWIKILGTCRETEARFLDRHPVALFFENGWALVICGKLLGEFHLNAAHVTACAY